MESADCKHSELPNKAGRCTHCGCLNWLYAPPQCAADWENKIRELFQTSNGQGDSTACDAIIYIVRDELALKDKRVREALDDFGGPFYKMSSNHNGEDEPLETVNTMLQALKNAVEFALKRK